MRFVDRSGTSPPALLTGPVFQRLRESYLEFLRLDPKERAQTRPPDRHLSDDGSIFRVLHDLFAGRCAFCESTGRLQIWRFRPTSEALPLDRWGEGRLHYGWLADAWQNLYLICDDCRPSPANAFPVEGPRSPVPTPVQYGAFVRDQTAIWPLPLAEKPLLIDPCQDRDMLRFFRAARDGTLLPVHPRGDPTIQIYRLNRDDLVAARQAAVADSADQIARRIAGDGGADPGVGPSVRFPGFLAILVASERSVLQQLTPARPPARQRAAKAPATPPLWHLDRIEITAFKALENITLAPPRAAPGERTPALLILGENAAGKSSILEAVALAAVDDRARARLGQDPAKLLLDPRFMGTAWMKPRTEGRVGLRLVAETGETAETVLHLTPTGFHQTGALPPDFPVFAYGAYRHYRDDFRPWSADRGVISLFRSDSLLSNPEKWLLTLPEDTFDAVVSALRSIFGPGGGFRIIVRDPTRGECLVVTELEPGVQIRTPLSSVSSGFRTILALACDVMRWLLDRNRGWRFPTLTMARGLILIDEVEAHLHPRWKVQIMDGLRRALPGMTFIVTTHDPLCLRGMRDGEVMVLHRVPGAAAGSDLPVMVESLRELPKVAQLTVEQLLTSDLFNLFDTDDPVTGRAMAELADALVAARNGRVADGMGALLARFRQEIDDALPVGSTEVSRLVQEAVADYVIERGKLAEPARRDLRAATKRRILSALERL